MLDSAFGWIGQIVEWFGKFIPRWEVLNTTYGAIKYKYGKNPVFCGPGIHWYWPAVSQWDTFPIARQTTSLPTQTIVTADDKVVAISGLIVYSVEDLMKLLPTTYQPDQAIGEITLTAVHGVCCRLTWATLTDEQRRGTLETKLRRAAQNMLDDYGVRVIRVQLTDLAPARVFKLINTTSIDG